VVAASTVVLAVLAVFLWKAKLPGPVVVYALGIVALALCAKTLGTRPRFLLTAFPFVVAPARVLREAAFSTLLAALATILGALTVLSLCTTHLTP
jgi:hypothetical protein